MIRGLPARASRVEGTGERDRAARVVAARLAFNSAAKLIVGHADPAEDPGQPGPDDGAGRKRGPHGQDEAVAGKSYAGAEAPGLAAAVNILTNFGPLPDDEWIPLDRSSRETRVALTLKVKGGAGGEVRTRSPYRYRGGGRGEA